VQTVLLIGIGPTALSAFESLADRFHVVAVVRDISASDDGLDQLAARARALRVPIVEDTGLASVERAVAEFRPECVVVSSYNRVLPPRMLGQSRFVNVHYAPLPMYRGRATVNWAIINGDAEAAISIHAIEPDLDAGGILYRERVAIDPDDTVADVYTTLNEIQRTALGGAVARYLAGYEGEPQDDGAATYGCTRIPADGEIDWSRSTERIYALVRALASPYPPSFTYLGMQRIAVIRASPLREGPRYVGRIPGRVVSVNRTTGDVDVLTGDGILRLHEVAIDDSDPRPASTIITSTRQTVGLRVSDLVARIVQLEAQLDRLRDVHGAGVQ
jgi:methionyl-tRNA formyltransferase